MQLYKHACMSASTFKAAKHSFATCIYVIQPHFKLAVTNRNHCCRITWSINTLKLVFNHPTETSKKWVRVPLINLLLIMINVTLSWTKWLYAVYIHLTQTASVFCIYVCKLVMIPVTVHIFQPHWSSQFSINLLTTAFCKQPASTLVVDNNHLSSQQSSACCVCWTRQTDPIQIQCKQVKFE